MKQQSAVSLKDL